MFKRISVLLLVLCNFGFSQLNKTYFKLYLPRDTATFKTTITDSLFFNTTHGGTTYKAAEINAEDVSGSGAFNFKLFCGGTWSTVARIVCDGTMYLWNTLQGGWGKIWTNIDLVFWVNGNNYGGTTIGVSSPNTFRPGSWEFYQNHLEGVGPHDSIINAEYISSLRVSSDSINARIAIIDTFSAGVIKGAKTIRGITTFADSTHFAGTLQIGNETQFKIKPFYADDVWQTGFYLGDYKVTEFYRSVSGVFTDITFNAAMGVKGYPTGYSFRVKGRSKFDSLITAPVADIDSIPGDVKIGGNMGIGASIVTPTSNYKSIKIGNNQIISRIANSTLEGFYINANVDFNGTEWIKPATGRSTVLDVSPMGINFYFSQNGVAGSESGNQLKASIDTNGTVTATTLNTGNGACEVYPMNQAVLTTSDVTHNKITATDTVISPYFKTAGTWIWLYNSLKQLASIGNYNNKSRFWLLNNAQNAYDVMLNSDSVSLFKRGLHSDSNITMNSVMTGVPIRTVYSSSSFTTYGAGDTGFVTGGYGSNHIVYLPAGFFNNGAQVRVRFYADAAASTVRIYLSTNGTSWVSSSYVSATSGSGFSGEYNVFRGESGWIYYDICAAGNCNYDSYEVGSNPLYMKFVVASANAKTIHRASIDIIDGLN